MVDVKGRGAFTSVGKDNGKSFYAYVKGSPLDGAAPEKSFNHEAVHLGVLSIEQRLADLGYDIVVDGKYGPKVRKAVKNFQKLYSLPESGEVGYTTGPYLWHDVIAGVGESYKFPAKYIFGLMKAESGGDPGAVGYLTPGDRGLFQFNTLVHDITYEQAHDFDWATENAFIRFAGAWKKYSGKGETIRINCSILQHKSPVAAQSWYDNEESPGAVSSDYVSRVRAFAKTF